MKLFAAVFQESSHTWATLHNYPFYSVCENAVDNFRAVARLIFTLWSEAKQMVIKMSQVEAKIKDR